MKTQTDRQIAGNHRRTLRKMRAQLLDMSNAWDGIDQFNLGELSDLADKVEQVACGLVVEEEATR